MLPVEAVPLLGGDISYTEEVPVRVRWVIADLGGHTVDEAEVLVTTDLDNELVQYRLDHRDSLIKAPSLLVAMEPDRELEAPGGGAADDAGDTGDAGAAGDPAQVSVSGGGYVDGEIVGTDEHTVAVAGLRRTSRTEIPASVMDELEDAVALMPRARRQGEWEQAQTHHSLLAYLREETEELAEVVDAAEQSGEMDEQELCRELSDILLQVLFHSEIANRRGAFDIGHVAGAFVAKMRSRAPYLFEEVERPVSREEQDRLWAEGRAREGKAPYKPSHPAPDAGDGQAPRVEPSASSFRAVGAVGAVDSGDATAAAGTSPLAAADEVIRTARERGYKDADIPTELRFPMLGLENDAPGDAEKRLSAAVEQFRWRLAQTGDATDAADAAAVEQ